jgi:hypothetical protein
MNATNRYSIRPVAIDHLMELSEHFKTTDISDLILAVCIERKVLLQCVGTPKPQEPIRASNSELDEFAAMLEG